MGKDGSDSVNIRDSRGKNDTGKKDEEEEKDDQRKSTGTHYEAKVHTDIVDGF